MYAASPRAFWKFSKILGLSEHREDVPRGGLVRSENCGDAGGGLRALHAVGGDDGGTRGSEGGDAASDRRGECSGDARRMRAGMAVCAVGAGARRAGVGPAARENGGSLGPARAGVVGVDDCQFAGLSGGEIWIGAWAGLRAGEGGWSGDGGERRGMGGGGGAVSAVPEMWPRRQSQKCRLAALRDARDERALRGTWQWLC